MIFCLASSLLPKKMKPVRLMMMGIIFGLSAYFVRDVTGSFILNIFCSSAFAILLLRFMGSFALFDSVLAGISSISLYLALEFMNVRTLQTLTGIDPILIEKNIYLHFLWFLPQVVAAILLSFIIRYFVAHKSAEDGQPNSRL